MRGGTSRSWSACGVLLWGEGGRTLRQRMVPTQAVLAAAAAGGAAADGAIADDAAAVEWLLPARLTASATSADSVLLATGLEEGSVIVWDTNLQCERQILQQHGAAVEKVALLGGSLLASYAADHTLHGYDVSADPETGQGKLVFRRRFDEAVTVSGC